MRKALVSLAGALGLAALYRFLRKRTAATESDPVGELRATIADTKTHEASDDEQSLSPEDRRRRVHERAQEAIDAMNDPPAA